MINFKFLMIEKFEFKYFIIFYISIDKYFQLIIFTIQLYYFKLIIKLYNKLIILKVLNNKLVILNTNIKYF